MNSLLWVLQVLLASHTAAGAIWKWSHSAGQTMPSLGAIPHSVWLALSALEFLSVVGLIGPAFSKRLSILVPLAAVFIVVEMLFFSGVHLASGSSNIGPVMYWLVVIAVCAFIVYGRLVRSPSRRSEFA